MKARRWKWFDARLAWPAGSALCALLVAVIAHVHYFNYTFDDAFISFRYAENFAQGLGLVYNPGERVEGYTNFLWTVMLAIPARLDVDEYEYGMLVTAKLLGLFLTLGTLIVVTAKACGPTPQSRRASALAVLYAATLAPLSFWGAGALETPLLTFLLSLALVCNEREISRDHYRSHGSAWLLLMAALTRPEPIVIAVLIVGVRTIRILRRNGPWQACLHYGLRIAVPYLVFLSFRRAYFGHWVPNTYYAKLSDDHGALTRGVSYVSSAMEDLAWGILFPICCLLVLVARRWSWWMTTLSLVSATMLCMVVYEGGDWMPAYRMLVPAVPLFAWMVAEAYVAATSLSPRILSPPQRVPAWVMPPLWTNRWRRLALRLPKRNSLPFRMARWGALVALLVVVVLGAKRSVSSVRVRDVPSGLVKIRLDSWPAFAMARWMKRNLSERGLLAISEAGVVPYYTRLPVLDMFGLTDEHIARQPGPLHNKFDLNYVLGRKPLYVYVVFRTTEKGLLPNHRYGRELLGSDEFRRNYEIAHTEQTHRLYRRRETN